MPRVHVRTSATLAVFIVTMVATILGGCGSAHGARVASVCTRFAAPSGGSGRPRGTARSPFHKVQTLVDALRPGQTGCLEAGTYATFVQFRHGGRRGAPITLRSAPGQGATILGRVYVPDHSNHVRVTNLTLDGRNPLNLPSPTVDSANDQFINDNVTNDHTAVCFELGNGGGYGQAKGTLIAHSRIHDCGVLPAANHEHGIYVANSVGARIVDNVIYNNADRGIQLYWNAQRTTIVGNVIDHNGEGIIISGDGTYASDDNLIVANVITNSTVRADVESFWPTSLKGTGNLVVDNCVHGGRTTIDRSGGGFVAKGNRDVNPRYVGTVAGAFNLRKGSPCALILAGAAASAASYQRHSSR